MDPQMEENDRTSLYSLHARFCKTLADANRLLIINELASGELPVGEISRRLELSQPNVSKHLAIMREHGLVLTRREGISIYYSLADSRISEAIKLLKAAQADHMERRQALARGGIVQS
jgi:DNA-binding transcriptional ArsR family regulator